MSVTFKEPNKYFVENGRDQEIVLGEGTAYELQMRHAVMISKCEGCVVRLKGKCNKVELDQCKKVTLVVPAVVSSIDMQKCASCEIHCEQRLPGASIDDCNSMTIYVPRDSLDILEIASSGGGSANLMVPSAEDPSEFKEYPVPFQFVHKFRNEKLVSEVSPLYTH